MNDINLHQLDLNLLVILDVLLQERHVTRAAKRLHRTQSAVSHALSRLRTQLGDPLLVRVGGEMRITPRAEQLAPELHRLLLSIQRLYTPVQPWDPTTSQRTFRLATPDFLLPHLLIQTETQAPGIQIEMLRPTLSLVRELVNGHLDLMLVAPDQDLDNSLLLEGHFTLPWVVFARRGHPAISDWDLKTWLRYRHIRIQTSSSHPEGPVDHALRKIGKTRELGPSLSHFSLVPPLLTHTDLLFTIPFAVLAELQKPFDLVALPCPFPIPPVELTLASNKQFQKYPPLMWFRGLVKTTLEMLIQRAQAQNPFSSEQQEQSSEI